MSVAQINVTALRAWLFVVGFVVGMGLFLLASLVVAALGHGGGYALYN